MMKTTIAVALLALAHSSCAVYWQQFYNEGCTGTVENYGTDVTVGSEFCIEQAGASASFTHSGTVDCTIGIYNDGACKNLAYEVGDGCFNFGGTGKGIGIVCHN